MADVGKMPTLDVKGSYVQSFGGLKDRTKYADPWSKQDMREGLKSKLQEGLKALNTGTGGSGSTDLTLVPIYVDSQVVDTSRKFTPLVELLPRVSNQGLTADYNRITDKGDAFVAPEDAALSEVNDTYERKSVGIKYVYSVGRVTGQAQASVPSYMLAGFQPSGSGLGQTTFGDESAQNALQLEVLNKTRAIKEKEEDLILNGDSATNPDEYDGIIQQQGTTNQNDLSGSALTFDDIEDTVRLAYDNGGRPNLAVASSAALAEVRKIMVNQFRYTPSEMSAGAEIPFGVPSMIVLPTMVGSITLIPSMFLTNTSGNRQIWFLDTDYIEMRVLQDLTYEELAKTNDSRKFMLKMYEALVVRAPEFNAFIDNIQ